MIKIDYESAWKELKDVIESEKNVIIKNKSEFKELITEIEKYHTRDFIELKRRTPEQQECYWKEVYTDTIIELAKLQKKLKDVKKAIE